MKKYEKAKIEFVEITTKDIILTSGYQGLNYGKGDEHFGVGVGSVTGSDIFKN